MRDTDSDDLRSTESPPHGGVDDPAWTYNLDGAAPAAHEPPVELVHDSVRLGASAAVRAPMGVRRSVVGLLVGAALVVAGAPALWLMQVVQRQQQTIANLEQQQRALARAGEGLAERDRQITELQARLLDAAMTLAATQAQTIALATQLQESGDKATQADTDLTALREQLAQKEAEVAAAHNEAAEAKQGLEEARKQALRCALDRAHTTRH